MLHFISTQAMNRKGNFHKLMYWVFRSFILLKPIIFHLEYSLDQVIYLFLNKALVEALRTTGTCKGQVPVCVCVCGSGMTSVRDEMFALWIYGRDDGRAGAPPTAGGRHVLVRGHHGQMGRSLSLEPCARPPLLERCRTTSKQEGHSLPPALSSPFHIVGHFLVLAGIEKASWPGSLASRL